MAALLNIRRQYAEGLDELRRAIELSPNNADAHATLGAFLRNRNQSKDAIAEYRRAIDLDSGMAILHGVLGALLAQQGSRDEAKGELRRALELDPHLAGTLYALATGLVKRASRSSPKDLVSATMLDTCWVLVTARALAPTNQAYLAAIRRIDGKLGDGQHCPPQTGPANSPTNQ